MNPLPLRARLFIGSVTLVALTAATTALFRGIGTFSFVDLVSLGLLLVLSDSVQSRGSRDSATIALGSVPAMAALPLLGGWGAILLACASLVVNDHGPLVKRLFNTSQLVVSASFSAAVFTALGGTSIKEDSFPFLIGPFVAALSVHCLINGLLVAGIVHFHQGVRLRSVLEGTMAKSVAGYVGYGLFGLLLAVLWDEHGAGAGPAAALLVLLPLFVARWAFQQYAEEQQAYDRTVRTLVAAVETKDLYTRGHSERVAAASVMIARVIGMREDRVTSLRFAGLLHDLGKLSVSTHTLQKADRLTEAEFEAIKRHPEIGVSMVRSIDFLGEAREGIHFHHERIDGRGYPNGLRGGQIPEFARVIAVADAFDSMTTTRSYRGARTIEDAVAELRRCAGTQFDPPLVEALCAALAEQGWETETTPMFEPPESGYGELVASVGDIFDHDDPGAVPTGRLT